MIKNIYIIKANGEKEVFDVSKLESSLRRSGASENSVKSTAFEITKSLKEGTLTKDIYKKAFSLLSKRESIPAARYSVRRAVLGLGPNGFPFEDFVGEIYRAKNFSVEVGKTIKGACVMHEVDIVASDEKEFLMAELKFHNDVGIKSNLKTALYVKARFEDIEKTGFFKKASGDKFEKIMLVTNTKFTSRAIQYGTCAGLTMVGWNYPKKGNLQDLIEETGLHPLTCLTTLSKIQKRNFLQQGIVLCRDLKLSDGNLLRSAGIPENKIKRILLEVQALCK